MFDLTESQRRAVETDSREVLVVAGAGSGKTRVLTERVAHLMTERGVSASEIMVLTFTRKAAGELKDRLSRVLNPTDSGADRRLDGMLFGTFHSVAYRILRTHGDRMGYRPDSLTVLDPADADMLLTQVCRDLGYLDGKKWRQGLSQKKVVQFREHLYRTGSLPDDVAFDPTAAVILGEYRTRLFEMNSLDFGSILTECQWLLRFNKPVLERYRQQIKHVLVDEAQDSDTVQYNLHDFFAPPATIFMVGDLRQTIYSWRGARPDLMRERHPDAEVIDLRECFRCGDVIVEASNTLIAANDSDLGRAMIGVTGCRGLMTLEHGRSADIVELVEHLRRDGFASSDIAVLARNHRTLRRLADICIDREIPHHRVGSRFDICETDGFRLLHAALRLSVNPADNMAFLRLVPEFGFTPTEYAELRAQAASDDCSHLKQALKDRSITADLLNLIAGPSDDRPQFGLYVRCLAGAMREIPEDAAEWWAEQCPDMAVAEALRWYALRDSQDDLPEDDVVILSTVHAAKGLEWPAVIVCNLNEGNFPSSMSLREDNGVLEERRVCYVAFTRAKERLCVHYRRQEDQSPRGKIQTPSRFLAEAGLVGELLETR